MEPGVASRSTPWRTSTPPNDFRTPRALSSAVMRPRAGLLAGGRVDRRDVLGSQQLVLRVEAARLLLALDEVDERRDDVLPVALREVRGVADPVLERGLAADVRPRRRVAA